MKKLEGFGEAAELKVIFADKKRHTIKPHDALQRVQALDISLVTAEDLGSGTEIVGKVLSILLPHLFITTQSVDLLVEGNIIGRPVTCGSGKDTFEKETNTVESR